MCLVVQNYKSCVYGEDMCVVNSIIPAMIDQKRFASAAADDMAAKAKDIKDGVRTDHDSRTVPAQKILLDAQQELI